jgi:hypothetical protein
MEAAMILVHQRYVAKPGLRERVLETRIEASRRLVQLGLPAGQIWVPVMGEPGIEPADAADVVWECTYADLSERERIRALQENDPVFSAIRTRQGGQLTRWTREHYRLVDWR